jgi:hypothetical protein
MMKAIVTRIASTTAAIVAGIGLSATDARAGRLPEKAVAVVDYAIEVRLDPSAKTLDGKERLTWLNPSTDSVADLWFHLYLNAFKNNKSTFVREFGGQIRRDRVTEGAWGYIDIKSLKLADGTDLAPTMRFEHPDDENALDQTVVRVALPRPVPPGGSVQLDIAFTAQLPRVCARTGYKGDFIMVGQWFPKLGVYEPAGMRGRVAGGWNCHQFHANSEFYGDYGRYHVEITVPKRFVVGATGRRVDERQNSDGTKTLTHEEEDIHDFAWTADPQYVEIRRTFSAERDVTKAEYAETARLLARNADEVRLSDVEVILLVQPPHLGQAERYIRAAVLGLKEFGLRCGRYPYRTLTVVDPAPGASGAAGMEYPTLITAGTQWLLGHWPFDGLREPEMVTVHELGHNFWYGLVGNNEFEEAWLDEGITAYATGRVMERAFGRETTRFSILGLDLGERDAVRMQNNPGRAFDAIRRNAWRYSDRAQYGFNSYDRPELVLRTLENLLGEQTMARIMRTFHERFRFGHPRSEDFYAVASEVAGTDLSSYFEQVVERDGILDYEVATVTSQKARETLGVVERGGKRATIGSKEATASERAADKARTRLWESSVLVRRRGDVVLPVDIELRFEGGKSERRKWDGRDRWVRYDVVRPERLLSASVDPERKLELDVSWLNDSRRTEPDSRAAAKWAAIWMFCAQQALALVGM